MEQKEAIAIVIVWLAMELLKLLKRKLGDKLPFLSRVDEEKFKKLIPVISILLAGGGYAAGSLDDPGSAVVVGGGAVAANELGKSLGRLVRPLLGQQQDKHDAK